MRVYICVYIYIYICVHIYIYIHIHMRYLILDQNLGQVVGQRFFKNKALGPRLGDGFQPEDLDMHFCTETFADPSGARLRGQECFSWDFLQMSL